MTQPRTAKPEEGLAGPDIYRAMYEASAPSVFTDRHARIHLVNEAVEELFGIPAERLIGKNVLELFSTRRGDEDRETIPALLKREGRITEHRTYIMRPDGERRAVSLTVRLVMQRGRAVGAIGTINDVTRLVHENYTDELTGLGNRRAFDTALVGEVRRAMDDGTPLGLLWVDHDRFKEKNKAHGYRHCDMFLRQSAKLLEDLVPTTLRFYPRVFRWGGDEMPVLVTGNNVHACQMLAADILVGIRDIRIPGGRGLAEDIRGTASIGIAMLEDVSEGTPEERALILTDRAGRALFQAKDRGRDMAVLWQPGF